MLQLQNISKTYPVGGQKFQALCQVSFHVEEGDFISIQGKSGSGKSTLLHIMGCLDDYDCGDYMIEGKSVKSFTEPQKAKLRNEKIRVCYAGFFSHIKPKRFVQCNIAFIF